MLPMPDSAEGVGTAVATRRIGEASGSQHGSRVMKKVRRNRQHAKFARLRRHLEISADLLRPRDGSGPARPAMPRRWPSSSG